MNLRILSPEELRTAYMADFTEAFPPSELKALSVMEGMRQRGVYEPLGIFDGTDSPLGYAVLWKHQDGRFILIDYLCVPAAKRSGGIGGILLRALREHFPKDTVFLAECEAPTGDPARDEWILRRLRFYSRNGATVLGYDCAMFGVHYKTLCWASPLPDEQEILRKHQEIYLDQFGAERYGRYVQLPLGEGEALRPLTVWTEA